jgi:hypothetical protein
MKPGNSAGIVTAKSSNNTHNVIATPHPARADARSVAMQSSARNQSQYNEVNPIKLASTKRTDGPRA